MDIKQILDEKEKNFTWKNLAPKKDLLDKFLQNNTYSNITININDTISIKSDNDQEDKQLFDLLQALKPWRKGPFEIFDYFIDTEWQSFIKYKIIEPYLNIENKTIIDVGCNNGYYLFKMLEKNPKLLIGIDPSAIFKMQFDLINATCICVIYKCIMS